MSRGASLGLLLAAAWVGCQRGGQGSGGMGGPAVVVVQGDGGAAPGPVVPEKEPNDQLAQAQPLVAGAGIRGTLGRPKDTDLFKLTVGGADRQTLFAQLSGVAELDLTLELLDQAGVRVLLLNDGKAGQPETLPAVTLSPGTYFLRVREAPAKGATAAAAESPPYTLTWKLSPIVPNTEQEPNDKPALATPIALGVEVSGQLAWRKDEDNYKISLAAAPSASDGGAPAASPSALRVDVGGLDDVALTVAVLDSIGAKLTEVKGAKGEPLVLRNIGVRPTEPFYIVLVRGSDANPEGRYTLRVSAEQGLGGPAEQEPNNDKAHATPLAVGAAIVGFVGPGDQDFFKVTSSAPQILRAELSCPERINIKLAVHDASGAELYRMDEGGRQEPETLADGWVPAGDVYLRVYAGKGESNPDQPYRLEVRGTPDDGSWEREPNGTVGRATPWPAGAPLVRGMIHPRGDEDLYRLPPAPPGSKGIIASVRPIERVNLGLSLIDESKSVLAKGEGAPEAERVLRTLIDPQHTYFLLVKDARGKESNPRDAYELHLTFE